MSCLSSCLIVTALIYWTWLELLLNPTSNALTANLSLHKPAVRMTSGRSDTETDLAFLRSRLHYFSSPLPARPYSLSINAEDYHYAPKPKHLRPARLLRILGPSFDPFWMSIERPAEAAGVSGSEGAEEQFATEGLAAGKDFDFSASPELTEGAARYQRKLEKEAEDVDLSVLPRDVAAAVRAWLVRSATCALRYKWVDLGPVFWPRWLRHTDCDQPGRVQSCSFPAGMACRRAQVTQIKILAWHCWGSEDRGVEAAGVADLGLAMYGKRCVWRQVPYPVVTACKCSCK
ncbi:hypothetical protein Z043_117601 [Scleropages formosus]|uniref:Noggin n=1 Tax=Scleropages formosus TaxID=113540 RepID=A0A0P7TSA9_SCLFO|nr:hypothetical protein Z043_117601 [Scleropages formosus]